MTWSASIRKLTLGTHNEKLVAAALISSALVVFGQVGKRDSDRDGKEKRSQRRSVSLDSPPLLHPSHSPPKSLQQYCQCEQLLQHSKSDNLSSTQKKNLSAEFLRRRVTIRRLDKTSTRQTLQSKYRINWREPLGEGAFGSVYEAHNRLTGEKFALKRIPKKFTDEDSFQREINSLIHLRANGGHPNICGLLENFDEGPHYYLILDFVEGGEMFDHLIRMGPYSEADASRLIREVAEALAFLHGVGVVHGDLKPENLMLNRADSSASVKLVDFGCAEILGETSKPSPQKAVQQIGGNTPAYSPPEAQVRTTDRPILPSMDMWSLGIILYIMLTGLHPFDLTGKATDEEITLRLNKREAPPLRDSPITAHLSESSIDLMERLIAWKPLDRITALQMLEHPWVKGETARKVKMADSDKKLSMFRKLKSKIEARVFADIVMWSDDDSNHDITKKKTSLIERSFRSFDSGKKGYLTTTDVQRKLSKNISKLSKSESNTTDDADDEKTGGAHDPISLSTFSDLLSENMKNKYFPSGHVVYHEGEIGNHMYFINSGTIEVMTKDGSVARRSHGDFFGEGALLHPKKIRSATISCVTPVHAIEITREYFEKFLADSSVSLNLREKDRIRKRNRAKSILRVQNNLKEMKVEKGDYLFRKGQDGDKLFILEKGQINILNEDDGHTIFTVKEGDLCGEHSLVMGRPRNSSAVCVSDDCVVYEMSARDFYAIYNSSSQLKMSLRELCLRREFQKAVVHEMDNHFPSIENLRKVFDHLDENKSGEICFDQIRKFMIKFDPSLTESEIREILESMDLNESGKVNFDEFRHVFAASERRAASM